MSERFTSGHPIDRCMICSHNRVDEGCHYPAVVDGVKCVVPCCQDCYEKRPVTSYAEKLSRIEARLKEMRDGDNHGCERCAVATPALVGWALEMVDSLRAGCDGSWQNPTEQTEALYAALGLEEE